MTIAVERDTEATGQEIRGHVRTVRKIASPSGNESSISADELEEAKRRAAQHGGGNDQRIALLGVILARATNVPFDRVADLLGVRSKRLLSFLHGEEPIPASTASRWEAAAQIFLNLSRVLQDEAVDRWLDTKIPDLGNKTPLEAVRKDRIKDVLAVTESYLDQSFT